MQTLKVALLGPEGTYTHQAADKHFRDLDPVFCSTIEEVFNSEVETKFVPIENSLGGEVSDTIEFLRKENNTITAEVRLPIQHALISDEGSVDKIETVKSHPQALSQSKQVIRDHGWKKEETDSTAAAVKNLGEREAAIASEKAAELTGKEILKTSVQDTDTNTTRFFVLNGSREKTEKTAMILEPGEDRPGLLHALLSCFAGHQINLSHIQSRPTKQELGDYYFYVEAEEGGGEKLDKAVQCLETYAKVRMLGSFSVGDSQ